MEQLNKFPKNEFTGLKDLNTYYDNYHLLISSINALRCENPEKVEKLTSALVFRIVDGIQYEHSIDMFLNPPREHNYDTNYEEVEIAFHENKGNEIEEIGKTVHSKIWKDAFIQYFDKIIEATILGKEITVDKKIPELPVIPPLKNNKTINKFLAEYLESFQNAYILLHILTGSVSTCLNKYIQAGRVNYVLQYTTNILAHLLANGNVGHWYVALDTACDIVEPKSSLNILYTAIDVFNSTTEVQFTDAELDGLSSAASRFIEKKVKGAFV